MVLGWILKLCSMLTGNYGVAIIIFTILIKAALLPLTVKQQKSMMKTQKLQPLLMELQEKYKNDKDKLSQETMKLYQKYQVNPMSGCLPMLIQLPIIMMLYFVVRNPVIYIMGFGENDVWRIISAVIECGEANPEVMTSFMTSLGIDSLDKLTADNYRMFGMYSIQIAKFLFDNPVVMENHWITEIGKNLEVINFGFLGLDLSQTPNLNALFGVFVGKAHLLDLQTVLLWSIPALSGLSSYAVSKLSQAQNPQKPKKDENGEEAPNPMKSMMIFMPLMSAWIAFTLPAAVGLYWIISNILSMVQQVVLTKLITPGISDEQIEGEILNAKKSRKKRKK